MYKISIKITFKISDNVCSFADVVKFKYKESDKWKMNLRSKPGVTVEFVPLHCQSAASELARIQSFWNETRA